MSPVTTLTVSAASGTTPTLDVPPGKYVVLAASRDEPRARSLLPDVHVSLLAEDSILPGLAELFEALGGELPSALAIVTGPSRSADIEQQLVVGVHGPGRVHVVLTAMSEGQSLGHGR